MATATETAVEAGGIVAGRRVGVARQAATGIAILIAILRATRAHATLQPEVSMDAICILDAETVRQIDAPCLSMKWRRACGGHAIA